MPGLRRGKVGEVRSRSLVHMLQTFAVRDARLAFYDEPSGLVVVAPRADFRVATAGANLEAVLDSDITYGHIENIEDCPPGAIERVRHYFLTYKQQPGSPLHHVSIAETYGRQEAVEMIARSQADYKHHFGSPDDRIRELRKLLQQPGEG